MKPSLLVLLCTLLFCTSCLKGLDLSQPFATSVYDCFKKDGISFVIIRGFCSYGAVDSHAVANLNSAPLCGHQPGGCVYVPMPGQECHRTGQ